MRRSSGLQQLIESIKYYHPADAARRIDKLRPLHSFPGCGADSQFDLILQIRIGRYLT
jgi:hypothetical protein